MTAHLVRRAYSGPADLPPMLGGDGSILVRGGQSSPLTVILILRLNVLGGSAGICFWNSLPFDLPSLPSKVALKAASSDGILTNNIFSAAELLNFLSHSITASVSLLAFKTGL